MGRQIRSPTSASALRCPSRRGRGIGRSHLYELLTAGRIPSRMDGLGGDSLRLAILTPSNCLAQTQGLLRTLRAGRSAWNSSRRMQKPEGEITEVSYMFPRPGPDKTPVQKVSLVTRAGDDLGCCVGYYKQSLKRFSTRQKRTREPRALLAPEHHDKEKSMAFASELPPHV